MSTQETQEKYSAIEKQMLREFFEDTIPNFPFQIRVQPINKASISTRRELRRILRNIPNAPVSTVLTKIIQGICEAKDEEQLDDFEKEIMQTHGYFCLLHMFDIYKGVFERNVKMHTFQYLRITDVMRDDNWEDFMSCEILSKISLNQDVFADSSLAVQNIIDFIENSNEHTLAVEMKDGESLYIPLSKVLSYRGVSDEDVSEFLKKTQEQIEELEQLEKQA